MEAGGILRVQTHDGAVTLLEYRGGPPHDGSRRRGGALTLDTLSYDELLSLVGASPDDAAAFADRRKIHLQAGGWQSWSAGWELADKERLPRRVLAVPELRAFTNRQDDDPGPGETVGHFIAYLRSGDRYLCLASLGGRGVCGAAPVEEALPPLSYRFRRSLRRVEIEAFCGDADWAEGTPIARLAVFLAEGFFAFKDVLSGLYGPAERFGELGFLGDPGVPPARAASGPGADGDGRFVPGGWESWYNHYTDIRESLILEDLSALAATANLIARYYVQRGKPTVFQIDDGWERAVGEWEVDEHRFPRGLRPVADEIAEAGYIPGLWLAPFLVTRASAVYRDRPEWLLRDRRGEPVVAGYNDKWDKRFFCLDLSRKDVLDYLGALMGRAVDEWGFRYLKLDFMYAGLLEGAFAEGGSAFRHYRRALEVLTARKADGNGAPVAYLGCGVPFEASYPFFPLSRIGADTKEAWDWPLVRAIRHVGRPSAYVNLQDTIGRSYLNGTIFVSDPDVVFMRTGRMDLADNEKELIALVNFLLAGQIMFSDDPSEYRTGGEEARLTDRIVALYDELDRDEYGAVRIGKDVFRLESRSGRIAGVLNLGGRPFALSPRIDRPLYERLAASEPLVERTRPGGATRDAAPGGRPFIYSPRSASIYRKE